MEALLETRDLSTEFITPAGLVTVVDRVSFDLAAGVTTALVGESGCGKSVTALSLMRILPEPQARISSGSVRLAGQDLLRLDEEAMRRLRGSALAMIFQEPMTSLNPVKTIGAQLVEALRAHRPLSRGAARREAAELLARVRIPDAAARLGEYPHRLSGGMRQRVMIAMALAGRPRLLIADEPTTALDVTIQAQILALLRQLQAELGMAILLITHNLGVVAGMASRVLVMYAGRIVEEAAVTELFERPLHPYSEGLLGATPRLGSINESTARLVDIPGLVPAPGSLPPGCAFAPRCPKVMARCHAERPILTGHARRVACFATEGQA